MDYLFQDGGKPKKAKTTKSKTKTGTKTTKSKTKTGTKTTKSKTGTKTKKGGNFLGSVGELVAPSGWETFATTAGLFALDRADSALRRGKNSSKSSVKKLSGGSEGVYVPRNRSGNIINANQRTLNRLEQLSKDAKIATNLKKTPENFEKESRNLQQKLQNNYDEKVGKFILGKTEPLITAISNGKDIKEIENYYIQLKTYANDISKYVKDEIIKAKIIQELNMIGSEINYRKIPR